jgi:hypothetical protein
MNSPVYVPSRERAGDSTTISGFLRDGVAFHIVVRSAEFEVYKAAYPGVSVLATTWNGIGLTRRWILQRARASALQRIWIVDDDLEEPRTRAHFGAPYTFVPWGEWLAAVEDLTAHPAYAAASGMNRQYAWPEDSAIQNKRVGYAVCIRTDGPWDYWPFLHEDTDMCLQILRAGRRTIKLPQYTYQTLTMGKIGGGCAKDYARGAAQRSGLVLVSKWDHYKPGLVRLLSNKEGNTVTRVRWGHFRATESLL